MNAVVRYKSLLTQFVAGEITAQKFEAVYLEMFKEETELLPEGIYETLNILFSNVDMYCGDPSLRDEGDLDDDELMKCTIEALEKLTG